MSKWGVSARVKSLREELLPKMGVVWQGTDLQFMEFLTRAIEHMPDLEKDAMYRYYIEGASQTKNETTGRAATSDSRFYMLLMSGRSNLAATLRSWQDDRIRFILEKVYG